MKKLQFRYYLLGLIVCGSILLLHGCNLRMTNGSCKEGAKLTANWTDLQIPVVQGSEVCDCTDGQLSFIHHNAEYFELVQQYAEKFKNDGWLVDVNQSKSGDVTATLYASKASKDKKLFVSFHKCFIPSITERFSKCSEVDIKEAEKKK